MTKHSTRKAKVRKPVVSTESILRDHIAIPAELGPWPGPGETIFRPLLEFYPAQNSGGSDMSLEIAGVPTMPYVLTINGIRVSVELLIAMIDNFTYPNPDRWYRFERKGDEIVVETMMRKSDANS